MQKKSHNNSQDVLKPELQELNEIFHSQINPNYQDYTAEIAPDDIGSWKAPKPFKTK